MSEITTSPPSVLADGEGEVMRARGTTVIVRAASRRLTVTDHTVPGGFPGPPLHVHPGFDELFLVLEGTLSMRVDGQVHEVGAGGSAYVPGATPHTFANATDEPVRFLVSIAPGGFEDYFRAMAAGDPEAAEAAGARFGYAPWPEG